MDPTLGRDVSSGRMPRVTARPSPERDGDHVVFLLAMEEQEGGCAEEDSP